MNPNALANAKDLASRLSNMNSTRPKMGGEERNAWNTEYNRLRHSLTATGKVLRASVTAEDVNVAVMQALTARRDYRTLATSGQIEGDVQRLLGVSSLIDERSLMIKTKAALDALVRSGQAKEFRNGDAPGGHVHGYTGNTRVYGTAAHIARLKAASDEAAAHKAALARVAKYTKTYAQGIPDLACNGVTVTLPVREFLALILENGNGIGYELADKVLAELKAEGD